MTLIKHIKIKKILKKNKARYILDITREYAPIFDSDGLELLDGLFLDVEGNPVRIWKEGFK